MASCPLLDKGMLFPILTHNGTLILFQLNTKDLGIDKKFTPRAKDQGPTSSLLIIRESFVSWWPQRMKECVKEQCIFPEI